MKRKVIRKLLKETPTSSLEEVVCFINEIHLKKIMNLTTTPQLFRCNVTRTSYMIFDENLEIKLYYSSIEEIDLKEIRQVVIKPRILIKELACRKASLH